MDLLFYAGGFQPTGGIEVFFHDLLQELRSHDAKLGVVCWGKRSALIDSLSSSGISIYRSSIRRGCRWSVPDKLLQLRFGWCLEQADTIVFGKLFRHGVQEKLAALKPRHARYVLVTSYRPSEMWSGNAWAYQPSDVALQSIDTICVQAPSFERELRDVFGYRGEVQVIPYLPPVTEAPAAFPDSPRFRIGFLGRLVKDKNLRYLLASFAKLREFIDAELHLFGEGDEREVLKRDVAQLNLSDSVVFEGLVPRPGVPQAIDSCHVFGFSSTTEGQCLAALEILARGRPLVCTPVGSFGDILTAPQFGEIAPLDNPPVFAEALLGLREEIRANHLTPGAIQAEFQRRFPREAILARYRSILIPKRMAKATTDAK